MRTTVGITTDEVHYPQHVKDLAIWNDIAECTLIMTVGALLCCGMAPVLNRPLAQLPIWYASGGVLGLALWAIVSGQHWTNPAYRLELYSAADRDFGTERAVKKETLKRIRQVFLWSVFTWYLGLFWVIAKFCAKYWWLSMLLWGAVGFAAGYAIRIPIGGAVAFMILSLILIPPPRRQTMR